MPELMGGSLCKSRKIINDTTTNSTEYFVITINNLQRGYHYTYTIRGFDAVGVPIYNDMGEFSTIGECIMYVMPDTTNSLKILIDDQVLILRNGKTYTMRGQEVKWLIHSWVSFEHPFCPLNGDELNLVSVFFIYYSALCLHICKKSCIFAHRNDKRLLWHLF